MVFFNYPSWLTIEIKLVPRIDMRRLELKYIFSKLIVYITLFACNLIDTYTRGKFTKNKFINFYMQTPKKLDNYSLIVFVFISLLVYSWNEMRPFFKANLNDGFIIYIQLFLIRNTLLSKANICLIIYREKQVTVAPLEIKAPEVTP